MPFVPEIYREGVGWNFRVYLGSVFNRSILRINVILRHLHRASLRTFSISALKCRLIVVCRGGKFLLNRLQGEI
jgi:hypothetical protein